VIGQRVFNWYCALVTITPRPYQVDARDAVEASWEVGMQRPAVVMATGLGKTPVIGDVAARWVARHRMGARQRVLVLAHRDELIEQAAATIKSMVGDRARVGIVQADRDNCTADIVVASVPTLGAGRPEASLRRRMRIAHVGLVVVDECHHATAPTYRVVMEHYGCFSEYGARALGVTATMVRSDEAKLNDIWQDVVYVKGIAEGVREGYLSRPFGVRVQVSDLDLAGVRKVGGDYDKGALGRALEGSLAPQKLAQAYREHAAQRQGLVFAPTVRVAEIYAEALVKEGFKTEVVHGKTPTPQRRAAFKALLNGDIQIISNVGVATEGTDVPSISCVVIGRPTKSKGLYTQMVGRGLRPWPGKADCMVLDIVGASQKMALSTPVELFGDSLAPLEDLLAPQEDPQALEEIQLDLGEEIVTATEAEQHVFVDGHMSAVMVDLFHGSKSAWVRTYGGIWFLPAGERLIVLKPQDNGLWGVVWCHQYRRESGWVASDVSDLGYAMAMAEENVTYAEKRTASRAQGWRDRKVTRAQLDCARGLGIEIPKKMSAGEADELLIQVIGSARIDPFLRPDWRR
jgi:superfamily II DNA or RNA helicase